MIAKWGLSTSGMSNQGDREGEGLLDGCRMMMTVAMKVEEPLWLCFLRLLPAELLLLLSCVRECVCAPPPPP